MWPLSRVQSLSYYAVKQIKEPTHEICVLVAKPTIYSQTDEVPGQLDSCAGAPGLDVIKLEYKLRLKIKRNEWLLADTCPQTANHCALF